MEIINNLGNTTVRVFEIKNTTGDTVDKRYQWFISDSRNTRKLTFSKMEQNNEVQLRMFQEGMLRFNRKEGTYVSYGEFPYDPSAGVEQLLTNYNK